MVSDGLTAAAENSAPERIYAIGDIHGHAQLLADLYAAIQRDLKASPVATALIVHLGDYIDRGPDSAACLSMLATGSPLEEVPVVNLLGNHEQMLLDALARPERVPHWLENGGGATLASWSIAPESDCTTWQSRIPDRHLRLIQSLQLSHQVGRYVFVHAGVRPGIRLEKQRPQDLLWIRSEFLDWRGTMLPEAPETLIVHGHTPTDAPDVRRNRIGIDTNAARGGKLTCAALSKDSVYFLQV